MPQFLILAKDHTDAFAGDRRLAIRQTHLQRLANEKANGNFAIGGAKLNEEGKMIGSMLIINAADADAARQWVQADPYIAGQVWEQIKVLPFRVAEV